MYQVVERPCNRWGAPPSHIARLAETCARNTHAEIPVPGCASIVKRTSLFKRLLKRLYMVSSPRHSGPRLLQRGGRRGLTGLRGPPGRLGPGSVWLIRELSGWSRRSGRPAWPAGPAFPWAASPAGCIGRLGWSGWLAGGIKTASLSDSERFCTDFWHGRAGLAVWPAIAGPARLG